MNAYSKKHRPSTFVTVLVLGWALLFLNNCGGESADNTSQTDPGTPPSLRNDGVSEQLVRLSEEQANDLDIQIYTIKEQDVTFSIEAPGQVFAAPQHISSVSSPINGRISKIYKHEGEHVRQGEPLLDLESLEFANLVADYLEATAEITYQQQQVERLKVLTEEKISPQRTLERAQADLRRAKSRQSAAMARLRAVGISTDEVSSWDPFTSDPKAELTLKAPISGVINQHLIELGESVNSNQKLLDIIDNAEVLVRGFVSPADAPYIKSGSPVVITERAEEGMEQRHRLEATVTSVNPALDATNKSIVLNTIVKTQDGWPIVGQNVRMQYAAQPSDSTATVNIPLSAVQYEGSNAAVFVQRSPLEYEKRIISIQRTTSDRAIVDAGLKAGDKIAVSQVFSLKALERFENFAE